MKREIELVRTAIAVLLALAAIAVVVLTASGNMGPRLSPPELATMTPPAYDWTATPEAPYPGPYPGPYPAPEYRAFLPVEVGAYPAYP